MASDKKAKVPFDQTIQAAKTLYSYQMDSLISSPGSQTLTQKQLNSHHEKAASFALGKVKTKVNLTQFEQDEISEKFSQLFDSKHMKNQDTNPAIGIDLGTTYSCVAVFKEGVVTIIPNELSVRTTPSYVAFNNDDILIGDPAKTDVSVPADQRIYDVKRLIGRSFEDPILQQDIKLWPFQVIQQNQTPVIKANGRIYYPEQISAKLLIYLKEQAETHLGHPVTEAVITVPAYFNDGQRQATKDAGKIAGLKVLRILNEPTAAAIAYHHQLESQDKQNVLVFDLGGGTFDVAILTMHKGLIEVKAVGGDTHIGGEDFDNKMVEHCMKEFKDKTKVDLDNLRQSSDPEIKMKAAKSITRLKAECERQKRNLTGAVTVKICLEALYDEHDFLITIRRDVFNTMNASIFERCIEIVDGVIKDVGFQKKDIQKIVLVGGSSKIPKVKEMVRTYFEGKQSFSTINPDEAVAIGAALLAAYENRPSNSEGLVNENSDQTSGTGIPNFKFTDVTPLPLGIETRTRDGEDGKFAVVVPKNTKIPCSVTKGFAKSTDDSSGVRINVFQGFNDLVQDNEKLGSFVLSNLPKDSKKGEPVDVNVNINAEGILHVTAVCPKNKAKNEIVVDEYKNRLKSEDLVEFAMEELFMSSARSFPL